MKQEARTMKPWSKQPCIDKLITPHSQITYLIIVQTYHANREIVNCSNSIIILPKYKAENQSTNIKLKSKMMMAAVVEDQSLTGCKIHLLQP